MFCVCKKNLALCLLLCCLVSGCATKAVQVVNEDEFNLMGRRITTLLQNRGILNAEGAYVARFIPTNFFPSPIGETLFTGLSPAFRFKLDPSLLPPSFAASRGPNDTIEMLADGFRLRQGPDVITGTLLGASDWDGDGTIEWFVLCRVDSGLVNAARDYYLVIEDTDTRPMKATLIAVYDCRSNQCLLYVEEGPGKVPAFNPESRVLEVEAGQNTVVPPPNAEKLKDPSAPDIDESKLDG